MLVIFFLCLPYLYDKCIMDYNYGKEVSKFQEAEKSIKNVI
jgi:hypothetical protein